MNAFHLDLARRILAHARKSGMVAGEHLTEQSLLDLLGTSRSPVRAALKELSRRGAVEHRPNQGFFLVDANVDSGEAETLAGPTDGDIYLAIARDRLAGELPDVLTENQAMRRYGIARSRLRRILTRISNEGWIEQRSGRGWSFLPLIDSPQAYAESYHLREALEPYALKLPSFDPDPATLAAIRAGQEFIIGSGYRTLGQVELFQANADFHERLAALSGNRFIAQTIERQNQLRRVVEYRQVVDTERVRQKSREHLAIIALLEQGNIDGAAEALGRHLATSRQQKTDSVYFDAMLRGTGIPRRRQAP